MSHRSLDIVRLPPARTAGFPGRSGRRPALRLAAIGAAAWIGLSMGSSGAADALQVYANARFGYRLAWRPQALAAAPEADNGDGRRFQPVRGQGEVLVWAGWTVMDETPESLARAFESDCLSKPAAYRVVRSTTVVVSCQTANGILYAKALIGSDRIANLRFTYPVQDRTWWDPLIDEMTKSFVLLPGAGGARQ